MRLPLHQWPPVPRTDVFNVSRVLLLSPDCMVFDEEEPFPLPLGEEIVMTSQLA